MLSMSSDLHGSEPMTMGSPASPTGMHPGHQSQYLPGYLLGESVSHSISPVPRLWSSAGGHSPPRSGQRLTSHGSTIMSPTGTIGLGASTPRLDPRGKDKGGAPPTKSLLQSTSSASSVVHSPFGTPGQLGSRTPGGLTGGTPAPPTTGLSQSIHESVFSPDQSSLHTSRLPASPAQLDPFYTQGDSLTTEDVLDETWVTVFGFPPAAASYILQQFSQYGNIVKRVIATEGNWMHLHYQSKIQAKKALSKNGKIFSNSIMVGVTPCIDKKVMEDNKENDEGASMTTTALNSSVLNTTGSYSNRNTPIRPLTAAYKAARSDTEVIQSSKAPQKNSGVINKAMEYMFGW